MSTTGTLLQRERLHHGWTQQELADYLGSTKLSISRWERGVTLPGPFFRAQLCSLFGKGERELGLAARSDDDEEGRAVLPVAEEEGAVERGVVDPALPLSLAEESLLVGRDALLALLKEWIGADPPPLPMAGMSGLPGVGKTTLAAALAHDAGVRAAFPDGILWAGLGPEPNLGSTLARWGALLGLSPRERAGAPSLEALTLAIHSAIGQRRLLLVLDDAWRPEDALACKVGGPGCGYLLTTRFPEVATRFAGARVARVEELPEEEGLALLADLAPAVVDAAPGACRTLVHQVGGLPLALTLLGNYLRVQGRYQQPRRIFQSLTHLHRAEQRLELTQPQGPGLSLASVIGLSERGLSEAARAALRAFALFPPKPNSFSEQAALAVSVADADTLDQLVDTGLLEVRERERYTLHQTVADFGRVHTLGGEERAKRRLVDYFTSFVEARLAEGDSARLDQESDNIFAALALAAEMALDAVLIRLVNAFYPFLESRGLEGQAEIPLRRAEASARRSGDAVGLASILLNLAHTQIERGGYQQAEALLREGVELARTLGLEALASAYLKLLGRLENTRGNYALAEQHLAEGLALARAQGDLRTASSIFKLLSSLERNRGELARSESYLREGLALGPAMGERERLDLMSSLAILQAERGDFPGAIRILEEGEARARELGAGDMRACFLVNLGSMVGQVGQLDLAQRYLLEGLPIARRLGLTATTLVYLDNLGNLAADGGDFEQGERFFLEGIDLARQMGSPAYLSEVVCDFACLCLKWGRIDAAEEALREALEVVPQGNRILIANATYGLARVAAARGERAAALELGERAALLFGEIGHSRRVEVGQWLSALPQHGVREKPLP
jgi:tetratricopeptide (TPR) repeat protein/transcriptional regulator with XRE-family HTH domain